MAGFTLLQLDCGRGLRSSWCPLQASSATAEAGGSVTADMLRIESDSNIGNGASPCIIISRSNSYKAVPFRHSRGLSRLSVLREARQSWLPFSRDEVVFREDHPRGRA